VLSDGAYLFDASWLFFAVWSMIVLVVGAIAFHRDFTLFSANTEATTNVERPAPTMLR
jgi:hypothetical protein